MSNSSLPRAVVGMLSRHRRLTKASPLSADWKVRPHGDTEVPDFAEFSLLCRQFLGADFKKGTFAADLVLTLIWRDRRTAELVPEGQRAVTMPLEVFNKHHWEPSIVYTSRAIKGVEVLTAAIKVFANGTVLLVQRAIVVSYNKWDVRRYPFDSQVLTVLVTSHNLMLDDFQLLDAHKSFGGVLPDAFADDDFRYVGYKLSHFLTIDGALRKSRGRLEITMARNPGSFVQTYLVPEMLLLVIAWSVFFFPPLLPFAMPRVATGIFTLLSMMTLNNLITSNLPPVRSGLTWVEAFNKNCLYLMIFTILLNVLVEMVNHQYQQPELGNRLLFELRLLYPVAVFITLGTCAVWPDRWSIEALANFTVFMLVLGFAAYLALAIFRLKRAWQVSREKAGEDARLC